MRRLARWCFTHRRVTVLAWVAALIGVTALHSAAGSAYSDNFRLSGTQSFDAVNLREWLRNAPGKKPMYTSTAELGPTNGKTRGMPNLNLTEDQIDQIISYLTERK